MKIICPECGETLRLSNPPAPGKRLRCPHCGEPVAVDRDQQGPSPRTAGRRNQKDDANGERRGPPRGRGKGLLVGLIGGGVGLALIGVLILGFALGWFGGGQGPAAPEQPLPALSDKESQLLEQLRAQLKDPIANKRRQAIATAGQNKTVAAHLYDDILAAWQDSAVVVKDQVVNFLGFHHNKPDKAVPILMEGLRNPQISRGQVLLALSRYGSQAKEALPAVHQYIFEVADTQGSLGQDVRAYRAIGATEQDVLSLLMEYLKNKKFVRRDNAADLLGAMGPAAKEAVPDLLAYAQEPDRFNRGFNSPAYQALKKIDPAAAKKAGVPEAGHGKGERFRFLREIAKKASGGGCVLGDISPSKKKKVGSLF